MSLNHTSLVVVHTFPDDAWCEKQAVTMVALMGLFCFFSDALLTGAPTQPRPGHHSSVQTVLCPNAALDGDSETTGLT